MKTDCNLYQRNTQHIVLVTGVRAAAQYLSRCLFAVRLTGWSHSGKASWERKHAVWQLPVCRPDSGLVCVCALLTCRWLVLRTVTFLWNMSPPPSHLFLTLAKCFVYLESSSGKKSRLNIISCFFFFFFLLSRNQKSNRHHWRAVKRSEHANNYNNISPQWPLPRMSTDTSCQHIYFHAHGLAWMILEPKLFCQVYSNEATRLAFGKQCFLQTPRW